VRMEMRRFGVFKEGYFFFNQDVSIIMTCGVTWGSLMKYSVKLALLYLSLMGCAGICHAESMVDAVRLEKEAQAKYITRVRSLGATATKEKTAKIYDETWGPAKRKRNEAETQVGKSLVKKFIEVNSEVMSKPEARKKTLAFLNSKKTGGSDKDSKDVSILKNNSNEGGGTSSSSAKSKTSPTYKTVTPSSTKSSASQGPKFDGKDLPKVIDFSNQKKDDTSGGQAPSTQLKE
jgi:hypothetical protein